ncbi:MAG TPA: hypothetical protein VIX89_05810 [Bryobacteraceae bacterium]
MKKTNSSIMMAVAVVLSIVSAGCSGKEFNEEKAKNIVEGQPLKLEGEQASLTPAQVDCGVRSELWEAPVETSPGHSSAHLTQQGRDLKFSDDVLTDPSFKKSYVQVKGDFALQVLSIVGTKDAPDDMKTGEFKVGVKIPHTCFPNPLPLMGVKKGVFKEDQPVTFRFRFTDAGWAMDQLLH